MTRLIAILAALVLGACGQRSAAPPPTPVFKVLATSDLRDAEPLAAMIEQATGVRFRFSFGGTMESTEAVLTGTTDAAAAWFANAKYLLSDPQGQARVKLQEKIMFSPIAVGVSRSAAARLGWSDPTQRVTWRTIADAARAGKLGFALSNPATSNQGFMALLGVVAASTGKTDGLGAADVDRGAIADFIKGYKLPGDNSSYLAEQFILRQGDELNAFINYESWLLSLNQGGKLREALTLVYPSEGIATADYPFMLLDEARRDDHLKVVAYLKSATAQEWLARQTLRRAAHPEVASATADLFPGKRLLVELPFSPDRALADGLIDAYLNEFRRPIASVFVIDTSGSMREHGRQAQLVRALHYIAGADASLTGRLARLTDRERLWLLPFAEAPRPMSLFELPAAAARAHGVQMRDDSAAKREVLAAVRGYADALVMTGGTALYDSVLGALAHLGAERRRTPGYQYSVVALTDGENTAGRDLQRFEQAYLQLPETARSIPVFMVLFGDAKEAELRTLVKLTGGRVFDARRTPLYSVFKDIRGYQ